MTESPRARVGLVGCKIGQLSPQASQGSYWVGHRFTVRVFKLYMWVGEEGINVLLRKCPIKLFNVTLANNNSIDIPIH